MGNNGDINMECKDDKEKDDTKSVKKDTRQRVKYVLLNIDGYEVLLKILK